MSSIHVEDGRFDDSPKDLAPTQTDPRIGHLYVDASDSEHWSETDEDDGGSEIGEAYDNNQVEDEDWEVAEGDFTKQYNRLRQHVAVRTGNAQGTLSFTNHSNSVAPLPAVNYPRKASSTTGQSSPKDKTYDQLAALAKYSSRIAKIDTPHVMGVGVNRKGPSSYANAKDKSDRATNEQVLDPRTRIILYKMIGRGVIHEVNGCISTGKEANVYHALTPQSTHLAVKIYKTSILIFKDRDKYVTGEYRFRRGYSRHNPRKMVKLWAEKEMRNLKRLVSAGIRCPNPLEVRENVLVLSFLGSSDGWASPRLKDAELPAESCASLYAELISTVRKMFHQCKLVHADLSEYNILYHDSHLWIIDVSQSVEHDHPSAFDFLRKDLKNVEEFFEKLGVKCLGLRRCFEFVTTENWHEQEEVVLRKWLEDTVPQPSGVDDSSGNELKSSSANEEAIFLQSYIPRSLNDVYDPERDVAVLKRGEGNKLIYKDTIGLVTPSYKVMGDKTENDESRDQIDSDDAEVQIDDDSDGEIDEDGEASEGGFVERKPKGHRHEDREVKKERKKAAKAEAREKRKHKMSKAEKNRIIKKSSR